jgi:DNA polymerase-3 subunit delta
MANASPNLWFIAGTDDYEVSRALKETLLAQCPPEEQALGLDTIDGSASSSDEAVAAVDKTLEALRTVGFFDASKLVCLRDVSFLTEEEPGKTARVKEAVKELAEEIRRGLPPGVRLIIHALKVDKRSSLFKACKENGELLLFDIPEQSYKADEYARAFVSRRVREAKLKVTSGLEALIVERAGVDTRQLEQEVEKLRIYCGDEPVTEAAVMALVAPCRERMGWDLLDEYSRRDLVKALQRLGQLMFMKNEPVGLIIQLQTRIRELTVLRIALDEGWLRLEKRGNWTNTSWRESPEVEAFCAGVHPDPRRMNPFRCGILAGHARGFSTPELQEHLRLAVETHDQMLSGLAPAELLLERFLIRAIRKERPAHAA